MKTLKTFLCNLFVCGAVLCASLHSDPLFALVSMDTNLQYAVLDNGVKTYVHGNVRNGSSASFRVVLKKPLRDQIIYAYEDSGDALEHVEEFFAYCQQRAGGGFQENTLIPNMPLHRSSALPLLPPTEPLEMAVVAVGNFSQDAMDQLIRKYFSSVRLRGHIPVAQVMPEPIQITRDASISKVAVHVHFPNLFHSVHSYEDVKEMWKCLILQDLFQARLERCTRVHEEAWIHPHSRFLYPVDGYALVSEEISENILSYLLWQAEVIRIHGFEIEEFQVAKAHLLQHLRYLSSHAHQPTPPLLASCYVDQFWMGGECCNSYQDFLRASEDAIAHIQLRDLQTYLPSFFDLARRKIHLTYPMQTHEEMTIEKVEELCKRLSTLATLYAETPLEDEEDYSDWIIDTADEGSGSIRLTKCGTDLPFCLANNGPIDSTELEPFHQLPLSERDKRLIGMIITNMAEKNIFQLALEKHSMERKGKKINHVHPLRFIGYIFSTGELKSAMKAIRKSSFKWDAFLSGFAKRMKLENERGNLLPYVADFSQLVGVESHDVNHYIRKKDWEGLLLFLLY